MNTKLLIIIYLLNSITPMSEALQKIMYGEKKTMYTNPFLLSNVGVLDYYKFMNLKFTDPEELELLNNYKPKTTLNGRLDIDHLKNAHKEGKLDFGVTAKPVFKTNKKHMDLLKFAEGLSSDSESEETEIKTEKNNLIDDFIENEDIKKVLKDADDLNLSLSAISGSSLNDSILRSNTDFENEDLSLSLPDIFSEKSDEENNFDGLEHERNQNLEESVMNRREAKEIYEEENDFVEKRSFNKRKVKKGKNDSEDDNELFNGSGKIVMKKNLKSLSESDEEIDYNLINLNQKDIKNDKGYIDRVFDLGNKETDEKVFREVVIVEVMDCKDCLDDPDLIFFTENY